MRKILMVIVVSLMAAVLPAKAATNYQDLWWVGPSENGWGINIAQQGNTMFATWFIYGASRQPLWLVMSNAPRTGAAGNIFTGALFQTVGTPFSQLPFVPLAGLGIDITQVGTATFTFADAKSGTLTYTVNGVQVVKQITRQLLSNISLAGTYGGGIFRSASGCATPALNGTSSGTSLIQITHTVAPGSSVNPITITEVGGFGCRLTGNVTQYGSSFEGSGTYQCAGDALLNGNWTATEGSGGEATFSLKISFRPLNDTCTVTGSVGGFKQQ